MWIWYLGYLKCVRCPSSVQAEITKVRQLEHDAAINRYFHANTDSAGGAPILSLELLLLTLHMHALPEVSKLELTAEKIHQGFDNHDKGP